MGCTRHPRGRMLFGIEPMELESTSEQLLMQPFITRGVLLGRALHVLGSFDYDLVGEPRSPRRQEPVGHLDERGADNVRACHGRGERLAAAPNVGGDETGATPAVDIPCMGGD